MARDRVSIDQFPGAVMAQLEEYVAMASDEVKEAVRTVSEDVKAEIQSRAPVKTGKYKKSWTVTKVEETAQSLVNTVHSAKHYRLTHLLENGHAKRGGGRTRSFSHIAPGEALAEKELLEIAASETGKFALLFEFDGDVRKIRHVLYNCSASRPSISAKTNEENREVQTETLTVKARPLSTGYVKAKTGDSTKASAAIPRIYRLKFHRDIYKDLADLEKSVGENSENGSGLDMFSLEMFENIAYIMAKHAAPPSVPDSPEDWLDSFNTFSIYQVLPQLIELWGLNVQADVQSKKNFARLTGK